MATLYASYPFEAGSGGGGSGTVTQINTAHGVTGGPITTTGTVSYNDTVSPSQSSNFSVSTTYLTYLTNTSSSSITATLPAANSIAAGTPWIFTDVGGSNETNPLTIARNGSDTIGGLSQNKLYYTNYGSIKLISDGVSNWYLQSLSGKLTRITFSTSGTYIAQAGLTEIKLRMRPGAGGGGGGGSGSNGGTSDGGGGGGGGGSGGSAQSVYYNFTQTPGTSYTITIGAGGAGGTGGAALSAAITPGSGNNGGHGGAGGTTSFGSVFTILGDPFGGIGGGGATGSGGGTGEDSGLNYPLSQLADWANFADVNSGLIIVAGSGAFEGNNGQPGQIWSNTYNASIAQYVAGNTGAGGATGSTNGGGGGGGSNQIYPGDSNSPNAASGGAAGLAGSPGSNGVTNSSGTNGCGGSGGGGGGGGGILASTGTASGAGGNGASGSNGIVVVEYNE